MPATQPYLVTPRHRRTGEYRTSTVRLTHADGGSLVASIRADRHYEPHAPINSVEEVPSSFATNADVVNVQMQSVH